MNGLLHGHYAVYKGADTIYHTTFHEGTGHYKDCYVGGTVMMEGDVANGCQDGIWVYYFYDEDKKQYKNVVLEPYDRHTPYPVLHPEKRKQCCFLEVGVVHVALR